ncbi:hypothetical protein OsccyDRAFT_4313 [Leptolyngbyaceae cyanobacterium JSC-12]|nr:hypothetical protein OsccyDRAFT_4313 [Leptolyngbyaceae cyanobacterium JSC-12]
MLLELTSDDLLILEKQRLERFRSFFSETLLFCFLHLDPKCKLSIHCSEPWIVDQLLSDIDQLSRYAHIIVGACRLSICFAQEEIYTTSTLITKSVHRSRRSPARG